MSRRHYRVARTEFGTCVEMLLGCSSGDLDCLRGKSAAEILAAQSTGGDAGAARSRHGSAPVK